MVRPLGLAFHFVTYRPFAYFQAVSYYNARTRDLRG